MGLLITALADGFRRAGVAHSTAGTYWPDDSFTAEQLEQLRAEPMLVVVEGVTPPEELEQELEDENTPSTAAAGSTQAPGTTPAKAQAAQPAKATGAKAAVKGKAGAKPAAQKPATPAATEEPKGAEDGKGEGGEGNGE
ncbi:conserved hypothetical protein [Pseudomonas sp. 8Z]|uniref:HI1506-related protein n=1 Tax=Pseudomonas sp. 8Z TaxID=2653166 RepID=UPI0012F14B53|nr:HI1506-related protein [Pseudomonas sp. 8Z]VXC71980.1 conserved hypothetical protein [Pseudomonas sp. 8Z]